MKREIVLALHRRHVEQNHDFLVCRGTCPMCDYAYQEAYNYWAAKFEETLIPVIRQHEATWEREGVMIGNVSSPALDILHEVLQNWVKLKPVVTNDAPDVYFDHPIVEEMYEREMSRK